MLWIVSDVMSLHNSLLKERPCDEEVQQTCMRYIGLEKTCATILRKLGRPKAMSFMPYRCTLSLLFVVPMALNLSHVAPVQQAKHLSQSLHRTAAVVTEQRTWQHGMMLHMICHAFVCRDCDGSQPSGGVQYCLEKAKCVGLCVCRADILCSISFHIA